jgi:hypothetical protein
MNSEAIKRFNMGEATPEDVDNIEKWLASGEIDLPQLHGYAEMLAWYRSIQSPEPSQAMTDNFYMALADEKKRSSRSWFSWLDVQWNNSGIFKLGYSMILVLAGLGIGWFANQGSEVTGDGQEIAVLSKEVNEMKEMMMLSLLKQESTSERLKAVHLTSDLPEVNTEIINALFQTLNNDQNINVRLATLEALYPYADTPEVREGLIESIALQDSPLVQVALAEMMVALQEKNSIQPLQQLLEKETTPAEVRREIEKSIDILI